MTGDSDADQPSRFGRIRAAGRKIRQFPSRVLSRTAAFVAGGPAPANQRAITVVAGLLFGVVGLAAYSAVTSGFETQAGSAWFVERVVRVATSLWTYALLAILLFVLYRSTIRKRLAQRAASATGMDASSVARLAAEADTIDGCTTVPVDPEDPIDDIADRVLQTLGVEATPDMEYVAPTPGFSVRESGQETDTAEDERHPVDPAVDTPRLEAGETEAEPDDRPAPGNVELGRLELFAAVSVQRVVWRFVAPTIALTVLLLLVFQIWVPLWLFVTIVLVSASISGVYYITLRTISRRRARTQRDTSSGGSEARVGIPCKRVDTDDMTVYYAWVEGRRYADSDPVRLAMTVADLAARQARGYDPYPAIQRKFARNLSQFAPTMEGYQENIEKREILDALVEEVAESDGLVPKNRLAERVVNRDRQQASGYGYDPRLVAECYEELVPQALVEEEVTVKTPTGDEADMTAVRVRTEAVGRGVLRAEAEFSATFQPAYSPEFSLPEIDLSTHLTAEHSI